MRAENWERRFSWYSSYSCASGWSSSCWAQCVSQPIMLHSRDKCGFKLPFDGSSINDTGLGCNRIQQRHPLAFLTVSSHSFSKPLMNRPHHFQHFVRLFTEGLLNSDMRPLPVVRQQQRKKPHIERSIETSERIEKHRTWHILRLRCSFFKGVSDNYTDQRY